MKAIVTLISSTSYMECEQIPIIEFIELYDKLMDYYKEMHKSVEK